MSDDLLGERPEPSCAVCHKRASELSEYVELAAREGYATAAAAVRIDEGTYNPLTNRFYCTIDYIKIGMPLGLAP